MPFSWWKSCSCFNSTTCGSNCASDGSSDDEGNGLSLVIGITTVIDAPRFATRPQQGQAYANRAYAFRNFILPFYVSTGFPVVVAGCWTPELDCGYTMFPVAPQYGDIRDVLVQRQAILDNTDAEVILYQSDDHIVFGDLSYFPKVMDYHGLDVVIPQRLTRMRGYTEKLNDGRTDGYIPFHCAVYRTSVLRETPWVPKDEELPQWSVDIWHSNKLAVKKIKVGWWDTGLKAFDVEQGGEPWR